MRTATYKVDVASDRRRRKNVPTLRGHNRTNSVVTILSFPEKTSCYYGE